MRMHFDFKLKATTALMMKLGCLLPWACVLCIPTLALAAPNELVLQLDTGLKLDSNPFRFTDDAITQPSIGTTTRRDTVRSADIRGAALIPLDSPETRLLLSGSLGARDFQRFNQLDNTESRLKGVLQWRFGDLWRGEFSTSTESQLFQYIDGSFTQKAMLKGDILRAEIALKISPYIEVPASIALQKQRYDNVNLVPNNRDDKILDVGGRWGTGTQSVARTGLRLTQSTFIERNAAQITQLDRQYEDRELYVSSDWQYSVMSRFNGRLGYLHRNYSLLQSRNFSVMTAELRAVYDHSPLTRVTAEAWNRPAGTTDPNTLYTINSGMQLGIRWYASPKMRLTTQLTDEVQTYKSSAVGSAALNPRLHRNRIGGGLVYEVTKDLHLYAEGFREKYDRGALGAGISQNVFQLGLEYTRENLQGAAQRTGLSDRRW